jgi:hypothetical protein
MQTLATSNTKTSTLVRLDDGRLAIAFSPEPDHQTGSGNKAIRLATGKFPVFQLINGDRFTLCGCSVVVTHAKDKALSKAEKAVGALTPDQLADLFARVQVVDEAARE